MRRRFARQLAGPSAPLRRSFGELLRALPKHVPLRVSHVYHPRRDLNFTPKSPPWPGTWRLLPACAERSSLHNATVVQSRTRAHYTHRSASAADCTAWDVAGLVWHLCLHTAMQGIREFRPQLSCIACLEEGLLSILSELRSTFLAVPSISRVLQARARDPGSP